MTSKLIDIRGPSAQEAEDGAWVVFHRREPGGLEHFIKASYYEGSYHQWGSTTPILGDNVAAVTAWADAMRGLEAFTAEEDEEDEVEVGDWEVGQRALCPDEGDRGEIVEIITEGLTDADAGYARVKMQLDYWPVGDLWEGSIRDIETLDDEGD
ncbi:hypothetical protein MARCHEWKA_01450 [Brevundimonas phage vB_BpoS-Marchewka]|uniref:Uncharacterized protein n=1 Tax=Brevundimonas phage vB_BpoS-Marchewka TaxID=2948604 RepID=A0A9E7N2P2_9CAUD|nr:hypothetical protein MARCHEWKA_01450 [Brevundimonas phage vB_BpoS-Marchewka]